MANIFQLDGYYDRFDPDKNYDRLLFRADRTLQSASLNDMQQTLAHKIRGVADALLKDGDIIRDCRVTINEYTGEAKCESGAIYLDGAVRGVPPAVLTVPVTGTVTIGVFLHERVITELEDPALYNPAIGTRGEGEPGAARLQVEPEWGFSTDNQGDNFYPVYTVDNGILRAKEAPPTLDAVTQALAKYDRDSAGGTYVVSGLGVLQAADADDGRQIYTVGEGRARVSGYPVELPVSRRLAYRAEPDVQFIDSEPHMSANADKQRINLDRYPVGDITQVRITREVTAPITHGGYTGSSDPLPDTSVVEIVSVAQGQVTYTQGTDYKLTAGKVDWSPSGLEPAPYSTYTCTYRHITAVAPEDADLSGFSVTGAVEGSQILVSYNQMLPRMDRLCLTRDGEFVWTRGVASPWNPQPPRVPEDMLSIATVEQTWDSARKVVIDGVRVVPMNDIAALNLRMDDILAQVAQNRLAMDVVTREAGAKKGLWVDPCIDDSMRDQGIAQTAAILGGAITLPVDVLQVLSMPLDIAEPATLPFVLQKALEQPLRTGSMPVNPYSAFEPLPAILKLTPAIDNWTDIQSVWASPVTEIINGGHYVPTFPGLTLVGSSSTNTTQVLGSTTGKLANLRQISVSFYGTGFGPHEGVEVYFDGIPVGTNPTQANASGVFAGSFVIPANIPAGSKQVLFIGSGGTRGSAVFTGQGQLTVQTLRTVTTTVLTWHDPLAQTYVLDQGCQIAGVDLWFTAKGDSKIVLQLRETTVGIPNQNVLGEKVMEPSALDISGNATRALFNVPVLHQAETENALVAMCDDAVAALALAEIGKWDVTFGRWVTSQPYQVGVMLSSSNNNTWTPHQDKDLAFRLLKAVYTETARDIALGTVAVEGTTDFMVLGVAEEPAAGTRVEYVLTLNDGRVIVTSDRQPIRLDTAYSGAVDIAVRLTGTEKFSPIVYPGTQLVCGAVGVTADYVTRAVPAGQDSTCSVILDAYLPAGTGVACELCADGQDDWQEMPFIASRPLDEGWQELTYQADTDVLLLRCRVTLTGALQSRPFVANPRVLTI